MIGKKALSSVVATVLIVLLTVTAIVIVSGIIIPFVRNNLNESTECLKFNNYFSFEEKFGYTCFKNTESGKLYSFSVRAGSVSNNTESRISGFKVAFAGKSKSSAKNVERNMDVSSNNGGIRMVKTSLSKIDIPKSGEVRTYVYTSDKEFKFIEIYPILKSGRVCEVSDSINIEGLVCASDINLEET